MPRTTAPGFAIDRIVAPVAGPCQWLQTGLVNGQVMAVAGGVALFAG